MKRRTFLQGLALLPLARHLPARAESVSSGLIRSHPRPGEVGWPSDAEWSQLERQVEGRLLRPSRVSTLDNPFLLQEHAGATQSAGWTNAWESRPSVYAVAAESTADVVAAVNFARGHHLRVVIKGAGHDYLGRSSGQDALLIWTHPMREVTFHESFRPAGAPADHPPTSAVSVQAGARWLEAYTVATTKNNRYVQGGGCASVGAAGGFPQGGGFGSFSKKFGTGAAGMLEAEIVTSDGKVLIANAFQHSDLFWALRGGGASTYGVVTRLTLLTHPLPSTFGAVTGALSASNDEEFRTLVERFCQFYREKLNNEHWGEQFEITPKNTIEIAMTFQGISQSQAEKIWAPWGHQLSLLAIPARDMWDPEYWKKHHPENIIADPTDSKRYWWAGNQAEIGKYWYTYQSRWIPLEALAQPDFLYQASRHWPVGMHMNKGLSGASGEALRRQADTSMNPAALKAAGLAILASGYTGTPVPGEAQERIARIETAMRILREACPNSGAYVNEADYFEKDWQKTFWGDNYPRLLAIKRKYDPIGLFHCHHGVGSEGWSNDQMMWTAQD